MPRASSAKSAALFLAFPFDLPLAMNRMSGETYLRFCRSKTAVTENPRCQLPLAFGVRGDDLVP